MRERDLNVFLSLKPTNMQVVYILSGRLGHTLCFCGELRAILCFEKKVRKASTKILFCSRFLDDDVGLNIYTYLIGYV